ncbi:MAG: hypothetical protein ACYTFT_12795, partial [Planctomycetota bacterium]
MSVSKRLAVTLLALVVCGGAAHGQADDVVFWANDRASTANGQTRPVFRIHPEDANPNATRELVGTLDFDTSAIAVDSTNGRLFYLERGAESQHRVAVWEAATDTSSEFVVTDPGGTVLTGPLLPDWRPRAGVNPADGKVYAFGFDDHLYTLDVDLNSLTAVLTDLGLVLGSPEDGGDLAFAPDGTFFVG